MSEINDVAHSLLSGSTNGADIAVTATSSGTATTVHTAVANTTSLDMVTLKIHNNSSDRDTIFVQVGSGDYREFLVEGKSAMLAMTAEPINNSITVKVYSGLGDVLCTGRVQNITIS